MCPTKLEGMIREHREFYYCRFQEDDIFNDLYGILIIVTVCSVILLYLFILKVRFQQKERKKFLDLSLFIAICSERSDFIFLDVILDKNMNRWTL